MYLNNISLYIWISNMHAYDGNMRLWVQFLDLIFPALGRHWISCYVLIVAPISNTIASLIQKLQSYKVTKKQRYNSTKIQSYKVNSNKYNNWNVTKLQNYKDIDLTKLPNYQVTRLPSISVTKLPVYQVSKLPSYQVTKIQSLIDRHLDFKVWYIND